MEKGKQVTYEQVLNDMVLRDKNDSERQTAPCKPAEDAVMLDNSLLSVEQNVDKVVEIINEKIHGLL